MKVPFVDLKAQYLSIKKEIDEAIFNTIDRTQFIGGPQVEKFEQDFANYIGSKHCISCANGTDSLEILMKAYGIGREDEVIIPANSWISDSEIISACGAIPIFVDIHPEYFTIDVDKIEEKITPKTKAIIAVHLYGLPAEMDEIMKIAKKHNLVVIEDCAQSHGAIYKGKKTGIMGHAASFSFYPGKNLGAYGDAGCILTNDPDISNTCRMIANHGQKEKNMHLIEGRNSRMDGIQAAVLNTKLKYLDKWTEARIENAGYYQEYLKGYGINSPVCPENSKHVYHLYVIKVNNRGQLQSDLKSKGVDTSIHYPTPLPLLPPYKKYGFSKQDFPQASNLASKILSLPMYPELSKDMINYVCSSINSCIKP